MKNLSNITFALFLWVRHVGNLEGRIVYKLDIQFTQPLPTYSDEEFNSHSKSIPRGTSGQFLKPIIASGG